MRASSTSPYPISSHPFSSPSQVRAGEHDDARGLLFLAMEKAPLPPELLFKIANAERTVSEKGEKPEAISSHLILSHPISSHPHPFLISSLPATHPILGM